MHETEQLAGLIEAAFEERAALNPQRHPRELALALDACLELLDCGRVRVAEKKHGQWVVNAWLKKAVLLYFRIHDNAVIEAGYTRFFDKLALKYTDASAQELRAKRGAHRAPRPGTQGCISRPRCRADAKLRQYRRVRGRYSMIDTWATVGSCAQIGRNVHLSGGAGIGGVLEPVQAAPTIIEDDCFIGARSEIVEGVVVEEGSVIGMGVFIGQSTRIYDRASGEILQGRVPAGSVVVPGTLPSADGRYALACAVIVKRVDAQNARRHPSTNCCAAHSVCSPIAMPAPCHDCRISAPQRPPFRRGSARPIGGCALPYRCGSSCSTTLRRAASTAGSGR